MYLTVRFPQNLRFLLILPLVVLVGSCNTASPHFAAMPMQRVTVDGSTFEVRVRGNLAEAVRINTQYAPRLGPIRERARRAIEAASGCDADRVLGDQALLVGQLSCPGGESAK